MARIMVRVLNCGRLSLLFSPNDGRCARPEGAFPCGFTARNGFHLACVLDARIGSTGSEGIGRDERDLFRTASRRRVAPPQALWRRASCLRTTSRGDRALRPRAEDDRGGFRTARSAAHRRDPAGRGCVAVLARLKPAFIHHERSKQLLREILMAFGCDPDQTHFDVPRLRSAMPGRLSQIRHRLRLPSASRTWYSAPPARSIGGCRSSSSPGQLPCLPSPLLASADPQRLRTLQLRPLECREPEQGGAAHHQRYPRPAPSRGAARRRPDCACSARRRHAPVFGAQLHSTVPNTSGRPLQHRFRTVHRGDAAPGAARPTSIPAAPARRCATTCGPAILPACRRRSSSLRRPRAARSRRDARAGDADAG